MLTKLTFQYPHAAFLLLAIVLLELLMTTNALLSSLAESVMAASSATGLPISFTEYSRWKANKDFLENPLSSTTTILAHCFMKYEC